MWPGLLAGASRACAGLLLAALLTGCSQGASHEMLNAVLWQQRSAEYRALARQTYRLAGVRLREALASPSWSAALEQRGEVSQLPPAVILDVDETVLDNTLFEARIVMRLGEFDHDSFARWCETGSPAAVPGARSFLREARSLGVAVFFYTSRAERLRECTRRALNQVGAGPVDDEALFLRGAGGKARVRAALSRRFRILLLVGDNLEDFVSGSRRDAARRRALSARYAQRFGRQWILLPNPMYGHWEAAYYGFDYDVPRARRDALKRRALKY